MRSTMLRRSLGLGVAIVLTTLLSATCATGDPLTVDPPETPNVKDEVAGASSATTPATNGQVASSFLPEVPRISVEAVKAKMDAGANIVILDTRPKDAYDKCHVAGAASIVDEPYSRLDSYEEILIYCA